MRLRRHSHSGRTKRPVKAQTRLVSGRSGEAIGRAPAMNRSNPLVCPDLGYGCPGRRAGPQNFMGGKMDWIIVGLLAANAMLFAGMGIWGLLMARGWRSPRLRPFGWLIAAVCVAFLLGSVQRLGLQAHRHGLVNDGFNDLLLADLQVVKSTLALLLGIVGVVLIRRLHLEMRRMSRVVSVMTERVTMTGSVSELGLTPRELQVLEIIGQGTMSDQQIAEELQIAGATAKTHVRNILRKAGLSNRRDLLVLVHADDATDLAH